MSIAGIIAILTLFYWLMMLADAYRGRHLFHAPPKAKHSTEKLPLVSVILAAKEEENSIIETVRHLLSQNYPRLEIIAINDRSQDTTGVKLEELRKWSQSKADIHTPLQIIHITHLPEGWLGKNHALYQGYLQAKGQYLLFTDADVRFQPSAITDAVDYMKNNDIQHLTLAPNMIAKGLLLRSFVHFFLFSFSLFVRPWRANVDHQRKQGMGIGAFNMLTRQAYEGIGTHKAIALRPDDDLQLGIRVKQSHYRQRVLAGKNTISVEWYPSLKAAIVGLEKNLFSGFHYSLLLVLLACCGQLIFFAYPWFGMLFLWDWKALVYSAAVVIQMMLYRIQIRSLLDQPGKEVFMLPASSLLLTYVIVRSVYLTLRQGGIYWRGTFYSLKELKRKC